MKSFIDLVRSWFRREPPQIDQQPIRTARKPRHLPIVAQRQQYDFSCVASVLQMTFQFFSGKHLSHARAIELTDCDADGAILDTVPKIMKRLVGTPYRPLKSLAAVRRTIKAGGLVVTHDAISYANDHATLVCGATARGYYVADPANGSIRWRSSDWLKEAASEFYAILPPAIRSSRVEIIKK